MGCIASMLLINQTPVDLIYCFTFYKSVNFETIFSVSIDTSLFKTNAQSRDLQVCTLKNRTFL